MGNQTSLAANYQLPTQDKVISKHQNEPLESYRREIQRDEHLKNLGFKRSKSLRKSISNKLRRKHRPKDRKQATHVPSAKTEDVEQKEENKKVPSFERIDRNEYPEPHKRHRPLVGELEPLPTHVQDLESERPATARRMDRLRRSLRSSLRRKNKDRHRHASDRQQSTSTTDGKGGESKPHQWQADEVAVRSGTCSFQVKYLGCVEVFESRGMQVCEEAVRVLKNSKRKSVRSILYVHGDGLRVVDDDTKGLIVDQTIEKVSFCAPDRNFERGFSYICRDGTTRRWMCHGFMAIKESGERLSHAVGCAFAICLEKKQQRDKLCTVSMTFDTSSSSFTRFGSFRQPSITERIQDPQAVKPSHDPIPLEPVENPYAVQRPHATDSMIQRQTSFRGFSQLQNSPFKRNLSLRVNELPSTLARQQKGEKDLNSSSSKPDEEDLETALGLDNSALEDVFRGDNQKPGKSSIQVEELKNHLSHLYQLSESHNQAQMNHFSEPAFDSIAEVEDEVAVETPSDPISSMCQQLSQELSNLSQQKTSNEEETKSNSNNNEEEVSEEANGHGQQFNSLPYVPTNSISPHDHVESTEKPQDVNQESKSESVKDPLANVKPVQYDNPWDFVPDQPNSNKQTQQNNTSLTSNLSNGSSNNQNNCDSSSGISSSSSAGQSNNPVASNAPHPTNTNNLFASVEDDWFNNATEFEADLNTKEQKNEFWSLSESGILDDPFDAEWAALATRNNTKNNPFVNDSDQKEDGKLGKAIKEFELQM